MKRLTHSLGAKIAAMLLLFLLMMITVLSAVGSYFIYYENYQRNATSYYDTSLCSRLTDRLAHSVYYHVLETDHNGNSAYWEDRYTADKTNFSYEIVRRDEPDTVLFRNAAPAEVGYARTYDFGDYLLRASVAMPLTVRDGYFTGAQIYSLLSGNQYAVFACLALSVLLSCAVLVFLLCAAGHRKDREEITLNVQDRIPLDLYLLAAAIPATALLVLAAEFFSQTELFRVVVAATQLAGAALIVLAALMTFATRVKAGKWWRNTLLYRAFALIRAVVRAVWSAFAELFRSIPLVWRTALSFCAASLVNLLLIWGMVDYHYGYAFFFFLWLCFNVLLLVAVCFVALNLQKLKKAGARLAAGDLDHRTSTTRMFWDFRRHAEHLNSIGNGMAIAVEQRIRSERLKTELITNVSHDIKTPLTSIINYADLLQKEGLTGQAAEHLAVLQRQSKRLQKLTEDLVEASKASTGNLPVSFARANLRELINQSVGEYAARLAARRLEPVLDLPEQDPFLWADGRLLWRVLDNLLGNACKYALPGTRLYIGVLSSGGEVVIHFKNISQEQLNVAPTELMERFVRGDSARADEGSGLGLSIARSLVELQKGKFSLLIDGDLFKVEMRFPAQAEDRP